MASAKPHAGKLKGNADIHVSYKLRAKLAVKRESTWVINSLKMTSLLLERDSRQLDKIPSFYVKWKASSSTVSLIANVF